MSDNNETLTQIGRNRAPIDFTKREYFAAMALSGLCHSAFDKGIQLQAEKLGSNSSIVIAEYAVDIADELIKALNKNNP